MQEDSRWGRRLTISGPLRGPGDHFAHFAVDSCWPRREQRIRKVHQKDPQSVDGTPRPPCV